MTGNPEVQRNTRIVPADTPFLKGVERISLGPASGRETILKNKGQFSQVSSNWEQFETDQAEEDTGPTEVDVYDVIAGGTWLQWFNSIGDPEKLRFTQGQINVLRHERRGFFLQDGELTHFVIGVQGVLYVPRIGLYPFGDRALINSLQRFTKRETKLKIRGSDGAVKEVWEQPARIMVPVHN